MLIKFKELLKSYGTSLQLSTDHFDQHVEVLDNGWVNDIRCKLPNLSANSDVQLVFYWNWGCLPEGYREKFQKALDERDYAEYSKLEIKLFEEDFMAYHFNIDKPVSIYYGNELIAELPSLDLNLMNHLDDHECEHG